MLKHEDNEAIFESPMVKSQKLNKRQQKVIDKEQKIEINEKQVSVSFKICVTK